MASQGLSKTQVWKVSNSLKVAEPPDVGKYRKDNALWLWVTYFGTHNEGWVRTRDASDYVNEKDKQLDRKCSDPFFHTAVSEAEQHLEAEKSRKLEELSTRSSMDCVISLFKTPAQKKEVRLNDRRIGDTTQVEEDTATGNEQSCTPEPTGKSLVNDVEDDRQKSYLSDECSEESDDDQAQQVLRAQASEIERLKAENQLLKNELLLYKSTLLALLERPSISSSTSELSATADCNTSSTPIVAGDSIPVESHSLTESPTGKRRPSAIEAVVSGGSSSVVTRPKRSVRTSVQSSLKISNVRGGIENMEEASDKPMATANHQTYIIPQTVMQETYVRGSARKTCNALMSALLSSKEMATHSLSRTPKPKLNPAIVDAIIDAVKINFPYVQVQEIKKSISDKLANVSRIEMEVLKKRRKVGRHVK